MRVGTRKYESYLTLEVNSPEGNRSGVFKDRTSLAGQESNGILPFLQQVLPVCVYDELRGFSIGLKGEFFSYVAKFQVRFESAEPG